MSAIRPQDAFPFLPTTERGLGLTRRDPSSEPQLAGYENVAGDESFPVSGDATAIFAWALGLASADGIAGATAVADGQPQKILTDELGRIWVRSPGGALADEIQGNVANDLADGTTKPVKIGGRAVASAAGLAVAVAVDDRVNAAYDVNGRQIVLTVPSNTTAQQIEGNVLNDDPDGTSRPVKVGGRAVATPSTGLAAAVAADDRVNAAFDINGRQIVVSGGDVANDDPDAGRPVKIGGRAGADSTSGFAAVAANDRVNAAFDPNGRQLGVVQGDIAHDAPDSATSLPVKIGGIALALNSQSGAANVTAGDRVQAALDVAGRQYVLAAGDQAYNVAGDIGNPVSVGTLAIANGSVGGTATAGRRGRLAMSVNGAAHALTSPNPITDGTTYAYTRMSPTAGDATGAIVVKASAGRLRRCVVYNNDAATPLWVQIHNDATLPPAAGGRAWGSIPIPALGTVEIDFSEADLCLSTGIMLALSTAPMTYTAAAVTGEFSAQYA